MLQGMQRQQVVQQQEEGVHAPMQGPEAEAAAATAPDSYQVRNKKNAKGVHANLQGAGPGKFALGVVIAKVFKLMMKEFMLQPSHRPVIGSCAHIIRALG